MSDTSDSTLREVEDAVLTFIREHPGFTRQELYTRLIGFNPHVINVALFRLQEKVLIEGHYERISDTIVKKTFHPAGLGRV